MNERIVEILNELSGVDIEITHEMELHELNLDSLLFVELIVILENEFNIEIGYEEMDFYLYRSVKDIIDLVVEKGNEKF